MRSLVLVPILAAAVAAPARADEPAPKLSLAASSSSAACGEGERCRGDDFGQLSLGVRGGALIPSAFNKLDTTFALELELGWQAPFFHRRFGLFGDVFYTQPTASGSRTDPRLTPNGGMESWNLTVRDWGFTLGARYLQPVGSRVLLLAAAGARLHLTRSDVTASAGATDLGENTEDSTRIGFVGRLGVGVRLGPGAVLLDLQYEHTPIDHLITGDDNTSDLAIQVGYTLFFL